MLAHFHYKALPIVRKVVTGLPQIQIEREGVWKGCAQGKNTKNPFPKNDSKEKGILDIIHSDIFSTRALNSLNLSNTSSFFFKKSIEVL